MDYKKKIVSVTLLLMISILIMLGVVYIVNKYIDESSLTFLFGVVFGFVLSPLIGYGFTYIGVKKKNKFFLVLSMLFYNLFFALFISGFYGGREIPVNLIEFVRLAIYDFILIFFIYYLSFKCEEIVVPAIIGLIMIIISAIVTCLLFEFSFISEHTNVYALTIGAFTMLHYIISLTAMKKYESILKAMSIGYGYIFCVILRMPFSESEVSIHNSPEIEENINNDEQ